MSRTRMLLLVFGAVAASWTCAFFPRGWAADQPQRVRIAYASRSSSAMPLYMALQKNFFKAENLEVEIIQMNPRLGASAVTGLVGGPAVRSAPTQLANPR